MVAPARSAALIADDHGLYRAGLGHLVRDEIGFRDVVEAASFDEALDVLASRQDISLALFDLSMPGMGGPESLKVVRECYPGVRVAVVTASEARDDVVRSIATGLDGFVPKSLKDDAIADAIRQIMAGHVYVPRMVTTAQAPLPSPSATLPLQPAGPGRAGPVPRLDALTPRQRDVLGLIVRGLSNKEIARELDIAEGTVKIHLAALFSTFNARNRTQLATLATGLFRDA